MPDQLVDPEDRGGTPGHQGPYGGSERRQRSGWYALGMTVLVIFALFGLAFVGLIIFIMIGMSNTWGNK